MWRRIPWLPLLFGVFSAWVLLSMLASQQRELSSVGVYAAVGAFGGALMVLLHLMARLIPQRPQSTAGSIGCGCGYAAAGFVFLLPVLTVAGAITGTGIHVSGIGPAILVLTGVSGLGVLGGIAYARFVRSEAARREAALAAQQLELARDLQQRLLPPAQFEGNRYRVSAANTPAVYVAGDFYDFVPLRDDRLLIVIADVAGKGVAAGLIMATVKAMIPLLAIERESAAELLAALNDRLTGQLTRREFVAIIIAIYDGATGNLSLSNAGLPDPLHVRGSIVRPVVVSGPRYPVGIRPRIDYATTSVPLGPGDRVLFITDGLPEVVGYEEFERSVAETSGDLDRLFALIGARAGAKREDDWTAVLLTIPA